MDIRRQPMQVAKWGNSLAIRLPAALVRRLKLEAGDEVELVAASSLKDKPTLSVAPKRSRRELVEDLRTYAGRLPRNFVFDRDEAHRPSHHE
jgi:antitoxin MazE